MKGRPKVPDISEGLKGRPLSVKRRPGLDILTRAGQQSRTLPVKRKPAG
jgi:hypothetical protein